MSTKSKVIGALHPDTKARLEHEQKLLMMGVSSPAEYDCRVRGIWADERKGLN